MSSTTDTVAVPERAPPQSLWGAVREALAGAHGRDFTEGPIGRAIFILAVPMVLEMVMESIFVVVDVFVVAHLGADAVATVGLTESFMTILYTLAMGLSIGARRDGRAPHRREGRRGRGAHGGAGRSCSASCCRSLIGVLGALSRRSCCALMGASPGVIANASFTRVMLGGNASVVLLFLINSVFRERGRRGDGDAHALAGERDQHRARPRARVRVGPAAAARRRGRGDRHDDRTRHGRAVRAHAAAASRRAACGCTRITSSSTSR